MRVLVCGGRTYGLDDGMRAFIDDVPVTPKHIIEQARMTAILDQLHTKLTITQLIHGAAKGADSLAGEWALSKGIEVRAFPADWDTYRRRVGPVRNAQMLREGLPELVVAFPGTRGTRHMVQISREAKIPVVVVGDWIGKRP